MFQGFPLVVRARLDRHRADPGARRQHGVQRVPGAGLDPGARTATCPASCTPAATGSRSPTASSPWRSSRSSLIWAFDAEVTRLIQLYIVGVFVSFTVSQLGMVRHWTRHLRTEPDPARAHADEAVADHQRGRPRDDRDGARRRAHHQVHARRLDRDPGDGRHLRAHAVDPPALRAGARGAGARHRRRGRPRPAEPRARDRAGLPPAPADDARAGLRPRVAARRCSRRSPSASTPRTSTPCASSGRRSSIPVPLRVLDSPFREITRPVLDVRALDPAGQPARPRRRLHPRVRGRALVGAAAAQPVARCGSRAGCCSRPGVVVASVPWQLASSEGQTGLEEPVRGTVPRGY